ncbi:hypothetical protein FB45DRAFT_1029343 [Roridomyces roridus]|uniref:Uncharacterized protein n=1 Tax=Roridomyces roridus TaxID=1738132 RepID=A0AAD7BPK6_9AGAR|nr:hypothetical protein FB45DRAFT_1029343 [Roridomyces roridus]
MEPNDGRSTSEALAALFPNAPRKYKPRNSAPHSTGAVLGMSAFSPDGGVTSTSFIQAPAPPPPVDTTVTSYTSNIVFRPPTVPSFIPRTSSPSEHSIPPLSESPLSESPLPEDPTGPTSSMHSSSPTVGLHPAPTRRPRGPGRRQTIDDTLSNLRDKRISPIDLLLHILDPEELSCTQYRVQFYSEESTKFSQVLDMIMADASD